MLTLGITLGDVTGIGPEVAFKALAHELGHDDSTRYVLIGDSAVAAYYCGLLGIEGELARWEDREDQFSRLYLLQPLTDCLPVHLPAGAPEASTAAVRWLKEGALRCLNGEFDGLVTAPVSKESILRAGHSFVGQTEFLAEMAGSARVAMMLLGHDERTRWLRVALATTHLPLKDVAAALSAESVRQTIELTAMACEQLGLPRRRIGVCGLNPHAGEGGKMGREEIDVIGPAIDSARAQGINCIGPVPADTLFARALGGEFDAILAMYHDQGLVPLKMVAFDNGVNWTVGLPFVRTSPDHGTAYDIAGQGIAVPSSMESAIRLARKLAASRKYPPPAGKANRIR